MSAEPAPASISRGYSRFHADPHDGTIVAGSSNRGADGVRIHESWVGRGLPGRAGQVSL